MGDVRDPVPDVRVPVGSATCVEVVSAPAASGGNKLAYGRSEGWS